MIYHLHENDLPEDFPHVPLLAVDTELTGLQYVTRDRVCLVQMSTGDGEAHLVRIDRNQEDAPNLKAVLEDPHTTKIFHYARADVVALKRWLDIDCWPLYCTKIASKLVRTYANRHGLKDLCLDMLGLELDKGPQLTDWAAPELNNEQLRYAAQDVLYLHALKDKLDIMLAREERTELAEACFDFLPARAVLDLNGWEDHDIFAHQ